MPAVRTVLVIGAGLAGTACAIRLAQAGVVAAQTVAFASSPASVISISVLYAPGLPGNRSGRFSARETEAYTAMARARFMGLPRAVPPTTEGLMADHVQGLFA